MRSHDDVDYSQRSAGPVEGEDDAAEAITRAIERDNPHWALWRDAVKRKQFVDELRHMLSGRDSSLEEEARARQASDHEFLNEPEKWNKSNKL